MNATATIESPLQPTGFKYAEDIEVRDSISPEEFRSQFLRKNRPLKLTGVVPHWPAAKKWTFDFFCQLGKDHEVLLEEGNVMQKQTSFRRETFADYVKKIQKDTSSEERGYLSVFRIFNAFPELRSDVDFSLLDQFKLKASTSGWVGPKGTVTGYHVDWGDNILAQIQGRKELHLAPPAATPNMYPGKKFDQGTTISDVNMDEFDASRFPRFLEVEHHRVVLNPGEMVFIPRGWWHHVRSLDPSISVSNITWSFGGILRDVMPHRFKQMLHDAGLWKCECTCHVYRNGKWVRK